jgi:DNA-binding NtrC family response regulator
MPRPIVVVLAEDEPLVRMAAAQALQDEGFDVREAEHAESALSILQAHSSSVHVLFTDVQMPGAMDGVALAHHTAKCWPWIGLLIASGGARIDRITLPPASRFLMKPYEHGHAAGHIRDLAALSA